MAVLKDSGDAAKGDQKGRKGGFKGMIMLFETNIFKIKYLLVITRLSLSLSNPFHYWCLPIVEPYTVSVH